MRLVGPRALAARALLVAASAAALVTAVLLTAFLLYAYLLPQAGVRQAVADAPAPERSVVLSTSAGSTAEDLAVQEAAARDVFSGGLAGAPLEVHTSGYGTSQRLPDDLPGVDPGIHGAYAMIGFASGLVERAELLDGQWPTPVAGDEPAEAALPAEVAQAWQVSVGDTVAIVDEIADEDRPIVVTAIWEPRDPTDPHWQLLGGMNAEEDLWGPVVVHRDAFVQRYQQLGTLEWLAVAEPAALADAGMEPVAVAARELRTDLRETRDDGDSVFSEGARIRTGLPDLADRLAVATVVNRSGLVLPAALLAVIAAYGLVLVARLLTAHRRGENALLRARGAGRGQLLRFTVGEAAMAVGPAALLAAPAATWLVRLADERAGHRSLGLDADLAGYGWTGPPLAWAVAVVAAAGCAVALAAPAVGRGRTWVAEQQEHSRPGRAAVVPRAGVDVALVGVAVLAWWQLRQYGQAVTPREVGGLGVDPLLVAAPVVAVLAATAVALRLLPAATRLGVRIAAQRDSFPGLLGMWQADRRPHAGPVLLLVLAVATAVLAPTVAATWQQSQRDQAAHTVGADLRLAGTDPRLQQHVRQLADLPEVSALVPAYRTEATLPEGRQMPVLAIDSARLPQVAEVRGDLAPSGTEELVAPLHAERPQPAGIALPADTERLTGTLEFDAPPDRTETVTIDSFDGEETVEVPVPAPSSHRASIQFADGDGIVSSVRLDEPEPGEPLHFDIPVPEGATAVVGLGAGLRLANAYDFVTLEPFDVTWKWELAAVGAGGDRQSLAMPDSWSVVPHPDQPAASAAPEHTGTGTLKSTVPSRVGAVSLPFRFTEPLSALELPALFTPDVIAAMGAAVGDVVNVPGTGATVRVAGTVPALPGVADGEGIAVDLAWLSLQRYLQMGAPPPPNEWWLSTDAPEQVATPAQELGLEVHDRRETTEQMLGDPLGSGVLLTLWAAAAGAALLAAFGLAVDSRANAVRRRQELAVLHTLGTSPTGLARALVVEQAVLAGLGVLAGVAVGVAVAAAMGTSLILTPAGAVPVPAPQVNLPGVPLAAPTVGLFTVAVLLGALVARRARREVAAGALRIGDN